MRMESSLTHYLLFVNDLIIYTVKFVLGLAAIAAVLGLFIGACNLALAAYLRRTPREILTTAVSEFRNARPERFDGLDRSRLDID